MGAKKQTSDTIVTSSFKDLKKIIKRKRSQKYGKPACQQKESELSDEDVFFSMMREVQEIEEFRKIPVYQKAVPLPPEGKSPDREALTALEEIVKGRKPVHLPDTQEYVEWIDRNYRSNIIEQLHRGRYSVQDCLDLHGSVVEEAEEEIQKFIRNSIRQGYRCIKLIHGRGLCSPDGPILKDVVINRLSGRYRKHIAAFVTARQCDGGLGAIYILLK